MTDQPFGTESEPEPPGTTPGVPAAAPAPEAPAPAPAPAPSVPANQPVWFAELIAGLHKRITDLEAVIRGHL